MAVVSVFGRCRGPRPYVRGSIDRYAVAGKQRKLGRVVCQAFQSGEPVDRRNLADGIHLGVNVERRKAGGTLAEVGDALAELCPDIAERP